MYNLMIVDNDRQSRERLANGLPLEKLGIHLCAEADNGVQAIELFMRHRPQIVITELYLPLISGMDAAKQMLQVDSDAKVIVLSDNCTLDHAREAVRCGVVDILTKSAPIQELEPILRKLVNRLRLRRRQQEIRQRDKELLELSLPLLRSDFFRRLLQTPPSQVDRQECARRLRSLEIPEEPREICTAILVPNYSGMSHREFTQAQRTLTQELQSLLQQANIKTVVLYDSMERTVVIAYGDQRNLSDTVAQKLSLLRDKMRYVYQQDFHGGVGLSVEQFPRLYDSMDSAELALCYWMMMGENHIVNAQRIQSAQLPPVHSPSLTYAEIAELLTNTGTEHNSEQVEQYLRQKAYETRNSVLNMQLLSIELLAMVLVCARELGGNVEKVLGERPLIYARIMQQNSIRQIMDIVMTAVDTVSTGIRGKREDSKYRALSDAKRYIGQNYADPELTLAKVAEFVNLSPSYVSQLFKRTDNCTFTEYLNHVRIEQAKRLLSSTHMRVYEVADAVGYQSSKYFFQLFKQITGKRPREFYQGSAGE